MTDIATNLSTIDGSLSDIKTAIVAKGVTPSGNITTYATAIGQISGGGGSGKYQLLERVKDDSNNEIGTVSGFFTDANDVEYAVVCLDAQYRTNSVHWCSNSNTVTNMPVYNQSLDKWWYDDAKETATNNTQLILDYCTANNYTSTACEYCRTQSFVIDGTTYYGQMPNMRELFDIWINRVKINTKDPTASSNTYTNFNNSRNIWSSSQQSNAYGWCLQNTGKCNSDTKSYGYIVTTVLELPNN